MKKVIIVLSMVGVILLCGCEYSLYLLFSINDKNMALKYTAEKLKCVNDRNDIINNKIYMMEKTLIVCYGLSKWEAKYYSVFFLDFSERYKIAWEIYPAIIKIESSFKTTLVSPKKCKGLMQIKEETAKAVADKIGINFVPEQSLWNEFLNLPIGCTYLSELIVSKGILGGVKAYLGGPAYEQNLSIPDVKNYIQRYSASVMTEYDRLAYIYRGMVAELTCNDSTYVNYSYSKTKKNLDPFNQDTLHELE